MTALIFDSARAIDNFAEKIVHVTKLTVMSESWTATEYATHVDVHAMGDRVRLKMSMGEFIALIAEGGKIVDLRKLQEPR